MKQIPIDQIIGSSDPIRKTWDEGKMDELAQSIKKSGVIVPIKVRPANITIEHYGEPTYEIVYGHRRVFAARLAGNVDEIPAIVEGVANTREQALIENYVRENMISIEIAHALRDEKESYPSRTNAEIGQPYGMSSETVRLFLELLKPEYEGVAKTNSNMFSPQHARAISAITNDPVLRKDIAEKVVDEELSYHKTRTWGKAYKEADTHELKQKVLETSGKLGSADNILTAAKMKLGGDAIADERQVRQREAFQEYDQAVKDFVDAIKLFERMIKTAQNAAKYGKFSPEGARFAQRRIDKLIDELESLKGVLEDDSR